MTNGLPYIPAVTVPTGSKAISPKAYFRRKPHIHIQVKAEGFRKLITQHYPEAGKKQGSFDLVLIPLE